MVKLTSYKIPDPSERGGGGGTVTLQSKLLALGGAPAKHWYDSFPSTEAAWDLETSYYSLLGQRGEISIRLRKKNCLFP